METNLLQSSDVHADRIETALIRELQLFKDMLGSRGEHLSTHTDRALVHFRTRPPEVQNLILTRFQEYSRLIASAVALDPSLIDDEMRLLRYVIKKLRLIVSDDLFDTIDNDTIVEIYNLDFVQTYRSVKFMDLCNYSLLDLLTFEFYELYERSTSVNEHIIETLNYLRQDGTLAGRRLNIPKHLMRERFSEVREVFQVEFGHLYPVYQWPHEFSGVLSTLRGSVYKDRASLEGVRFL